MTGCDRNAVEAVLRVIAEGVGGQYSIVEKEEGIYAGIDKEGINLIMIRVTKDISELVLNTRSNDAIRVLRILRLLNIAEVISKLKVLPTLIALSRIEPSKSLHLVLLGRAGGEILPNIKVAVRGGYYEASASYCRISNEENTCELLHELLTITKNLWSILFKEY